MAWFLLCSERLGLVGRLDRGNAMLTRKQHELLSFIDEHLTRTGFSPSFEEMKEALQLRSKSGIHRLISALEERGFLKRRHHRARALEVVRRPEGMMTQQAPQRPGARRHGRRRTGALAPAAPGRARRPAPATSPPPSPAQPQQVNKTGAMGHESGRLSASCCR